MVRQKHKTGNACQKKIEEVKGGEKEMIKMKKEQGITLIALIITIIILVILAAVSIRAAYNSGIVEYAVNGTQNYVEGSTKESSSISEAESLMQSVVEKLDILKVEELANVEYIEARTNNITKTHEEIMEIVAQKLNEQGYASVPNTVGNTAQVTGFTISDENISLVPSNEQGDKTKSITIGLTKNIQNTPTTNYLVTINGIKHEMNLQDEKIKIYDDPIEEDVDSETYKLTITPTNIVTNGSVILTVNGENITAEKVVDIINTVNISVSSTTTEVEAETNLLTLNLKNNLDTTIGENKNIKINVAPLLKGTIAKGEIITLDGKEYRILKVDGNQVKLLALYDYDRCLYSDSETDKQKYAGSILDTKMNEFYEGLKPIIKNAIVPKEIRASWICYYTDPNSDLSSRNLDMATSYYVAATRYYGAKILSDYEEIGNRNVYALDFEDILEYFGETEINSSNIVQFMFNNTPMPYKTALPKIVWLRTAVKSYINYWTGSYNGSGDYDDKILLVDRGMDYGNYTCNAYIYHVVNTYEYGIVRPCFVLDISKLS